MTCWTTSAINLTWLTTTLAASTVADSWIPSTGQAPGVFQLTVPIKALEYEALEWIVNFEDYYQNCQNIPMTFSASKFVWVSHCKGGNVHVVEELIAVEALGDQKMCCRRPPWLIMEKKFEISRKTTESPNFGMTLTKSTNKRTLSKRISHGKRPFGLTIMNEEQGYWISS
ncbi:hypothetical protein SELMODRAFT_408848 [Selaginella moellendorffii]|uniref:Uncharacterized protein n=1 Tax=Selaginella moellendorffii TaxID=88036 RepID=D8RA54_SELML|nr:hypothetical protein SELMODRAFT_408848 [Selaginella moellendorffii]